MSQLASMTSHTGNVPRLQAKGFSRVWSNTRMSVSRNHSSWLCATLTTLAAMGSKNTSGYGSLCSALRVRSFRGQGIGRHLIGNGCCAKCWTKSCTSDMLSIMLCSYSSLLSKLISAVKFPRQALHILD